MAPVRSFTYFLSFSFSTNLFYRALLQIHALRFAPGGSPPLSCSPPFVTSAPLASPLSVRTLIPAPRPTKLNQHLLTAHRHTTPHPCLVFWCKTVAYIQDGDILSRDPHRRPSLHSESPPFRSPHSPPLYISMLGMKPSDVVCRRFRFFDATYGMCGCRFGCEVDGIVGAATPGNLNVTSVSPASTSSLAKGPMHAHDENISWLVSKRRVSEFTHRPECVRGLLSQFLSVACDASGESRRHLQTGQLTSCQ